MTQYLFKDDVDTFVELFHRLQDIALLSDVIERYDIAYGSEYHSKSISYTSIGYEMSDLRYELCVTVYFDDDDRTTLDVPLRYLWSQEELNEDAKIIHDLKDRQRRAVERYQKELN